MANEERLVTFLQDDVKNKERRIRFLKAEIVNLKEQIQVFEKKEQDHKNSIMQYEDLQVKCKMLENQIQELDKQNSSNIEKLKRSTQNNANLTKMIDDLMETQKKSNELATSYEQMKNIQLKLEDEKAKLEERVRKADLNNANLTKMIDDLMGGQDKSQSLNDKIKSLESSNLDLQSRLQKSDVNNANLTKMIDDLMDVQKNNEELVKINNDLESKVAELDGLCQDLKNQIPQSSLNELITDLQSTVNKLRRRNKKLEKELENLKNQA